MAKRYMLVGVADREIIGTTYGTLTEARDEMNKAWQNVYDQKDTSGEINDWSAYITDGPNHENYDWKIVEIPDEKVTLTYDNNITETLSVNVDSEWLDKQKKADLIGQMFDEDFFIEAIHNGDSAGLTTKNKMLQKNIAMLTSLKNLSADVPKGIKVPPIKVRFEEDGFIFTNPLFEVLFNGKPYSRCLSYEKAENTINNLINGMKLVLNAG